MTDAADGRELNVLTMLSALKSGGAERVQARVIPSLADAGVSTTVCTVTDRTEASIAADFADTGAPHISLSGRRAFDPAAWLRLRRMLSSGVFDVVHAHDQQSQIVAGYVCATSRVPLVFSRHVVVDWVTGARTKARAKAVALATRIGPSHVITVSDAVADLLIEKGYPSERTTTVYNGIDTRRFTRRRDKSSARRLLGWDLDRPVATMISVMRPMKAFDLLFDAAVRVRTKIPDLALKIVGDGKTEQQVRRDASPLGDTVEFCGARDDIPVILEASDVVVLASRIEALPTVLIEAGAMGTPVVATRVGGVPEIVDDRRTGLVVDPEDPAALAEAIEAVLLQPDLACRLGESAPAHIAAKFSFEAQARATREVFDHVRAAAVR